MSNPVRSHRSSTALWVIFFVNGAVLASWAPRIPQVKAQLALTDGQMGWALLGVAAGSVPALVGTARLLRTVSPRILCRATSVVFPAALPLVAVVPNGWALGLALAVLGAASGCLDVAMNTAAIDYQNRARTHLLSRLHGGYSLGVLGGAASGAIASTFDVTVTEHFVAVSVALVLVAVVAGRALPPSAAPVPQEPTSETPFDATARRRGTGVIAIPVLVGAMAVAALLIEGMVTDWSALLVSRDLGGGATLGAVAVVVFSCAMFLSRSFGDLVIARLGAAATVAVSGAVAAAGATLGFGVQHEPWAAVITVGVIGLAIGPLFPLLISEAGHRSRAGAAVATAQVSAVGYGAYLVGPPFVGFLADHVGLATSFVLVSCLCAAVLLVGSYRCAADRLRLLQSISSSRGSHDNSVRGRRRALRHGSATFRDPNQQVGQFGRFHREPS